MFEILAALALIKRKNASGAPSLRVYINSLTAPSSPSTPSPPSGPPNLLSPLEFLLNHPDQYDEEEAVDIELLKEDLVGLTEEDCLSWAINLSLCGVRSSLIAELFYDDNNVKRASVWLCGILRGYIETNKLDKVTRNAYNEYFHLNKCKFEPLYQVDKLDQLKMVVSAFKPHAKRERLFIKSCLLMINQPSLF